MNHKKRQEMVFQMNEVTVDLSDLIRRIGKKWKLIVCAALVCAVAANLIGYRKANSNAENAALQHEAYAAAAQDLPGYFNEELYRLRSQLSENQASFAEAYAEIYRGFLNQYGMEKPGGSPDQGLEAYMMFLDSYKDVISVMSGTQREYYELLLVSQAENGDRDSAALEPFTRETPSLLQTKWILIGLFLGAVFACVLIVLPYLMTDRLRTEKDLAYSFGIPVLSTGRSNDEKKIRDTARVIQTLLKKDNSHAVFLWGSEDPASAKTREDLRQILQETCGEQVRCGDGMAEPEVINRLTETDTVVLIEKLGKSRYADIQKQLRLCGLTDCKVLGSIVLL